MIITCEICQKHDHGNWPMVRGFYQEVGDKTDSRLAADVHILCSLFFEELTLVIAKKGIGIFVSNQQRECYVCKKVDAVPKIRCKARLCENSAHIQCLQNQDKMVIIQTHGFLTKVKCYVQCDQHVSSQQNLDINGELIGIRKISLEKLTTEIFNFYQNYFNENLPYEIQTKVGQSQRKLQHNSRYDDNMDRSGVQSANQNGVLHLHKKKSEKMARKRDFKMQSSNSNNNNEEILEVGNENGSQVNIKTQQSMMTEEIENQSAQQDGGLETHSLFKNQQSQDQEQELYLESGYPNYQDEDRQIRMKEWWDSVDELYFNIPSQKKIDNLFKEPQRESSKFNLQSQVVKYANPSLVGKCHKMLKAYLFLKGTTSSVQKFFNFMFSSILSKFIFYSSFLLFFYI